jgi:hypothetical protein
MARQIFFAGFVAKFKYGYNLVINHLKLSSWPKMKKSWKFFGVARSDIYFFKIAHEQKSLATLVL